MFEGIDYDSNGKILIIRRVDIYCEYSLQYDNDERTWHGKHPICGA